MCAVCVCVCVCVCVEIRAVCMQENACVNAYEVRAFLCVHMHMYVRM